MHRVSRGNIILAFAGMVLLFGLHDVAGIVLTRGDYTPFSASPHMSALTYDETQLYAPGVAKFAASNSVMPEVDVLELSHLPNGYPILHSVLLGSLAKLVGLESAWMIGRAVSPAIVWLIFAFVLRERGFGISWWSVSMATICALVAVAPRNALLLGEFSMVQPLELGRTPQPSLSLVFAAILVWWMIEDLVEPRRWSLLVSGVAFGLLFHAYYFFWVAAGFALSLLVLGLMVRGNRDAALRVLSVLAVGGVIGFPAIVRSRMGLSTAVAEGGGRFLMERVGVFTRAVDFMPLMLAIGCAIAYGVVCARDRAVVQNVSSIAPDKARTLVLSTLTIGGLFGLNFQLLTGFDAQHTHFWNRVIQPFGFLLLAGIGAGIVDFPRPVVGRLSWLKNYGRRAAVCAAVVVAGIGVYRQIASAQYASPWKNRSSSLIVTMDWLRRTTPQGSVIGSLDEEVVTLLPTLASRWTFVPLGDRSMATSEEILFRYCCLAYQIGLDERQVIERLSRKLSGITLASKPAYVFLMEREVTADLEGKISECFRKLRADNGIGSRNLDFVVLSEEDWAVERKKLDEKVLFQTDKFRVVECKGSKSLGER